MAESLPHHKLFGETHVTFDQVVHVVDVAAQQERALHADAEGETCVDVRVDAGDMY